MLCIQNWWICPTKMCWQCCSVCHRASTPSTSHSCWDWWNSCRGTTTTKSTTLQGNRWARMNTVWETSWDCWVQFRWLKTTWIYQVPTWKSWTPSTRSKSKISGLNTCLKWVTRILRSIVVFWGGYPTMMKLFSKPLLLNSWGGMSFNLNSSIPKCIQ